MSKFGDFSLLLRMAHYTSYCLFDYQYTWISVGNPRAHAYAVKFLLS